MHNLTKTCEHRNLSQHVPQHRVVIDLISSKFCQPICLCQLAQLACLEPSDEAGGRSVAPACPMTAASLRVGRGGERGIAAWAESRCLRAAASRARNGDGRCCTKDKTSSLPEACPDNGPATRRVDHGRMQNSGIIHERQAIAVFRRRRDYRSRREMYALFQNATEWWGSVGLRLPQLALCGVSSTDYNCGLVHQFLASLIQFAIFLGQFVRRIVHQFSAALVQVFTPLGEFLARIDNVIGSILSFTAKSAASSFT